MKQCKAEIKKKEVKAGKKSDLPKKIDNKVQERMNKKYQKRLWLKLTKLRAQKVSLQSQAVRKK